MLYITRQRYKESVKAENLAEINKLIDTDVLPALEQVEGVQAAQAYNSLAGEVTFVLDIQNMATVDRILADPGCRAALAKIYDLFVRVGGEVLYDRPRWEGLYGS